MARSACEPERNVHVGVSTSGSAGVIAYSTNVSGYGTTPACAVTDPPAFGSGCSMPCSSGCMVETAADIAKASMPIPMFGHVGDGNFHCMILIRPGVEADLAEAKRFNERLVERSLAMEGTCTGEHGVGIGKIDHLRKEHGTGVDLMVAIKRTLDPENLLNPGKLVAVED